ncbi:ABC transporter transmembrane domain-containing protein [Streptomyces sp. SCSIO ZS0520]|uniref:ABC transporter transmembrane domain-containing protein n=1 Tax=Streptomyces sp. SCSIO ZS0520 TaxID=2892996 RepID=UPI0029540E3D|nr:ABC transporter transmembrane domain-containing protein [Streptomyces sp. SCSIO ZS0520]
MSTGRDTTAPPSARSTEPQPLSEDVPPRGEERTDPTMSDPAKSPERTLLPTASGAETLAAVRGMLRGHRLLACGAVGVLVAGTGIGLLTAPLLGHIVDLVVEDRGTGSLHLPMVLLVVVALVRGGATALGSSLVARLGETVLAALRERFIERALRLPLERVEEAGSGDLVSRVTGDVSKIAKSVRQALPEFARSTLTILLTLVGLAVLDWRFLLAALLAMPVQWLSVRWYLRRAAPVYAAHRVATGALQHQLLDSMGGVRTVRAFRLNEAHTALVARRSQSAVDLAVRGTRVVTGFFSRLNLAEFIGLSAVLVTGFWLVDRETVSIGTATAAALYFHSLFNPINAALFLIDDAQSAGASLARLVGVSSLAGESGPEDAPRPVDGTVEVSGLGYSYVSGHPVLEGVDLKVAGGERIALVGASGAGKTTLAKLIAGVHQPSAGTIRLGGTGTGELGPAGIRQAVTLISQEVHVFAGPLAEDLRLARPGATEEELRAALTTVDALDWVSALPEGLDTVVGEGGHRLTVTQAQHLALARLVLADPPIAILDEATADAGSAGARVLEAAALRALEGRTGLLVAHRLPQAATADRVVVLDRGRVVETGTHEQLVAAGGRYAALWAAWSDSRKGGEGSGVVPEQAGASEPGVAKSASGSATSTPGTAKSASESVASEPSAAKSAAKSVASEPGAAKSGEERTDSVLEAAKSATRSAASEPEAAKSPPASAPSDPGAAEREPVAAED